MSHLLMLMLLFLEIPCWQPLVKREITEFQVHCLTHEKNFTAIIIDYKCVYKQPQCMVPQVYDR